MSDGLAIGIDIGGTKIAAGLIRGDQILDFHEVQTPADDAARILDELADLTRALRPAGSTPPVGVAAAGYLDRGREAITYSPNLPWRDVPLREQLLEQVGMPVILENDANAAAWGEYRFGAGQGSHSMVMITVGTGIGGGVIIDGHLLTGGHGVAGELGHIQVVSDLQSGEPPRPCGCGSRGCWEMYGSGNALKLAARSIAMTPPGARLLARADGEIERLTGTIVTEAAVAGDPVAVDLVDALGRWLGEGLASISAVLDPEVILVGGGVAEAGDVVMAPLTEAYRVSMQRSHRPAADVRPAALGNQAGMLGAADLALNA